MKRTNWQQDLFSIVETAFCFRVVQIAVAFWLLQEITQYKMCFTNEVTVGMMAMNLSMALFLQLRGQSFRRYQIFYVFFVMEVLQYCQYLTLDDCSHWLNRLTTVLAYVHVCFQPVSVNYYAFGWEPNGDVVKTVVRIGLIGGSLMLVRLPYLGISQFLSEKLSWMGNEFPDNSMAGTPDTCARTAMCGPQLCARTGNAHLRWEVRWKKTAGTSSRTCSTASRL